MRAPLYPPLRICEIASRQDRTSVTTVRIKLGLWNIVVAAVRAVFLTTLVGYVFLENFTYRP